MKNEAYCRSLNKCLNHPDKFLKPKSLMVKTPDFPDGIRLYFPEYCPKCKLYLGKEKMVSKEELALENIKDMHKKNYTLSEIEVTILKKVLINPRIKVQIHSPKFF